jgi:uroporphyrinogen decarboxylase
MHREPELWSRLLDRITDATANYVAAQVRAGADAVQVFDSWAGVLAGDTWAEHCLPHTDRLIAAIKETGAAVIAFVNGSLQHLPSVLTTAADCVSLDWKIPIGAARRAVPAAVGIQGNLDPCALFLEDAALVARVERLLAEAGPAGHVMNLGHGIGPDTDPAKVRLLVETVRRTSPACA